jgi:hypothetical protein
VAEALQGELLALQERLATDTPFWAANCATILNERKQPVKLIARPWQARTPETPPHVTPLDEAIERQRAAGQPIRIIILKARKLGFSTWVQAKFMQRGHPARVSVRGDGRAPQGVGGPDRRYGPADVRPVAERSRARRADLRAGQPGRTAPFSIKPQIVGEGQSRQGTRWYHVARVEAAAGEASVYTTMTAGAKGGGRASTPSHAAPLGGRALRGPDFVVGVLNAVPKEPGTIVVIESTAKGFNHFHERGSSRSTARRIPRPAALPAAVLRLAGQSAQRHGVHQPGGQGSLRGDDRRPGRWRRRGGAAARRGVRRARSSSCAGGA